MGFGPQLVDLDHDGRVDLLSGSWPGELFFFRGGPERSFAPPEMLKDEHGVALNVFGGWSDDHDGTRLLTGHGEIVEEGDATFVLYHGERFESTPERPISITGSASAVHAFDWDGDGDLDLLVGDIEGRVALVPNGGTPKAWAFGGRRDLEAGGEPLKVEGDAGPFVADWDGDGLADLLVGSGDGSVTWYRNDGERKRPRLAKGFTLVAPVQGHGEATVEPRRGIRAKVCATDWNGDGKLDLLLGDYARQKVVLPEPTPEERAAQAKVREQLEVLYRDYSAVIDELHGPKRTKDRAERKAARAKLEELSKRMGELQKQLPNEDDSHGWVWFFERR